MTEKKINQISIKPKNKLPNLSISTIWMISFGFFGVQMAFQLQSSNM